MSYAIIRNSKYTMSNINGIYRHNERKNTNYSNKDIQKEKSINNYSIKNCPQPYSTLFKKIKEKNQLSGWIKKTSNVACEYIITSDKEFFDRIGVEETKRYFQTAYKFVTNYKNLGEEYILSSKVHMDESTPHMHLVFIPVVHIMDKKSGKQIDKVSCSEFWKGKNSYAKLQDNFYNYMIRAGFKLERGLTKENEHMSMEKLKSVTNYNLQELQKNSLNLEKEIESDNIEVIKTDYRRIIRKFNTIAKQYTRVKEITDKVIKNCESLTNDNKELEEENEELEKENNKLNNFLEKTFEYVSILFDFPKDRLKRLVKDFIRKIKE